MDEQQRRIIEDLSGTLGGELYCDPLTIAMYSSDASIYQIAPLAVAFPKSREDLIALSQYSSETDTPLIPRGAGSGVAGQAIGAGIVVDFSRHMRHVEAIDDRTVTVQPGIVREELNRVLRKHGRYFPPDPANASVTTIGSMLAIDAAGSRSVRVGSTRDHVRSIEVVLAGGNVATFGHESLDILKQPPPMPEPMPPLLRENGAASANSSPVTKRSIISRIAQLLVENRDLIDERQPHMVRNCSGYYLRGVLASEHLHMNRLLVGSEGTLGLFASARLHTSPLPEHRGLALLLFGSMETAMAAVTDLSQQQPSACDLLDRRVLSLGREADRRFAEMIPPTAEAGLIVEQTGYNAQQARDRIAQAVQSVRQENRNVVVGHEAYNYDDVEFLWSLPKRVVPMLIRLTGPTRPTPFVEDVAVPPEVLREFSLKAQRVFQKHQLTTSLYAHAAAGQFHFRPFLEQPTQENSEKIEEVARDLYEAVFSVGGTIAGEHGDGLSRTAFIRSQYGPLYKVFQQVKDIFDPHNLMNPGKIISDDAHLTIRNFRPRNQPTAELVDLQLQWSSDAMLDSAAECNGCGGCRTQKADTRMCPFFRIDPIEEASPRAKANLMRNYACGTLTPKSLTGSEMKRLADQCFNCKQCEIECPSNVNIPQLVIEAKAAHVASNGLSRADWLLSRAHSFGTLGCRLSPIFNWAISSPFGRWILERFVGIHRLRKLPRFASRSLIKTAGKARLKTPTAEQKKTAVIYFVDHYANFHDTELGRAFVMVMEHNGFSVHMPGGQTASGMAMISAGDLDAARSVAEQNVMELVELAREGFPIVCSEPAAALCLKYEYPQLLDHPDVQVVADQVVEAGQFLSGLTDAGKLAADFSPLDLDLDYHHPCHLKALGEDAGFTELLRLIPGVRLNKIEKGCSGMAGTYGLTRANFRKSVRIGWPLISHMRDNQVTAGVTECSSCKFQMEQGTTTPTIHPLKLMAYAYGIMPEIEDRLKATNKRFVVT
ncbi:MAG: anaerobic glycerol-3-phosphate dehydrogenase subunit C [Planctomycetaceae bacterium]|nr:anaerobic glycerol-3-phosphate dehydrogenase subunit C [Planctomycetaceae bacterium]